MRRLVLSTFLYACESCILTAELERRIQALKMTCYRRLLNFSYTDRMKHEEVRGRIQDAMGVHVDLLTTEKKQNLRWYSHISRSFDMANTILRGIVKGERNRGDRRSIFLNLFGLLECLVMWLISMPVIKA